MGLQAMQQQQKLLMQQQSQYQAQVQAQAQAQAQARVHAQAQVQSTAAHALSKHAQTPLHWQLSQRQSPRLSQPLSGREDNAFLDDHDHTQGLQEQVWGQLQSRSSQSDPASHSNPPWEWG